MAISESAIASFANVKVFLLLPALSAKREKSEGKGSFYGYGSVFATLLQLYFFH